MGFVSMIVIQYTQFSCFTNCYDKFQVNTVFQFFYLLGSVEHYYTEHFYAIFTNSNLMDEKSPFRGIKILELLLIDKLIL